MNATAASPDAGQSSSPDQEEQQRIAQVLTAEYGLLAGMLSAVWSASLVRTSLFLAVISALAVSLGLAAQASGGFNDTFTVFALVALPLTLFLGLATFARTVEIQREAIVYITGMNRIRHFMTQSVPASRPYIVLSTHDDDLGVYRSQGTGMRFGPPRYRLVFALVQTQGIVAVMCSAIAAVLGGLAGARIQPALAWPLGAVAFVVTLVALLAYWNQSIRQLQAAIRPMSPTPPDAEPRI